MVPDDSALPKGFDEKTGPASFPAEVGADQNSDVAAQIAALQDKIVALTAENEKNRDQMLRALAEAENTRRRSEKDREDMAKFAISGFARNLLTVADNLHRAIAAVPSDLRSADARIDALVAGVEATERDLLSAFDRFGIRKAPALGVPFNANLHEVMFEIPAADTQPGLILQVVEEGYTIHDRLLRPARVGVAKANPTASPPPHTIDEQA